MRSSPSARLARPLGLLAAIALLALAAAATGTAIGAGPIASSAEKSGARAHTATSALARCLWSAGRLRSAKSRAARRRACRRTEARRARATRPVKHAGGGGSTTTTSGGTTTTPTTGGGATTPTTSGGTTSPTTSGGTTTPTTNTRNAFGADVFGVSTGGAIQNEDATTLGRDLDGIAGTRTRWVRVDINWAQIQGGGPSSYYWAAVDRVVQGATARGIKVLGTILYTPAWARPSGTSASYGPDPSQYAAFAATAARHYAAMGVHAYEIWNEPNNVAFWTPKPDPAAYTRMLKAAYAAIKGADAQATVVTGGTAPEPSDGTQVAPVDFLRGIYANGGGGSFDAVGHHPYCFPAYAGDPQSWSAWYQMYGTSPSLRSVMVANGDGAKKIWATEFGAPTNGPSGSQYVSEATQAQMLTGAYQLYSTYDWGGPLFFYQGRDQGTSTNSNENFFGFLRADFSAKPSYTAYQQAVATL